MDERAVVPTKTAKARSTDDDCTIDAAVAPSVVGCNDPREAGWLAPVLVVSLPSVRAYLRSRVDRRGASLWRSDLDFVARVGEDKVRGSCLL